MPRVPTILYTSLMFASGITAAFAFYIGQYVSAASALVAFFVWFVLLEMRERGGG